MHRRWRAFVRRLKKLDTKDWTALVVLATQVIALVRALFGDG